MRQAILPEDRARDVKTCSQVQWQGGELGVQEEVRCAVSPAELQQELEDRRTDPAVARSWQNSETADSSIVPSEEKAARADRHRSTQSQRMKGGAVCSIEFDPIGDALLINEDTAANEERKCELAGS